MWASEWGGRHESGHSAQQAAGLRRDSGADAERRSGACQDPRLRDLRLGPPRPAPYGAHDRPGEAGRRRGQRLRPDRRHRLRPRVLRRDPRLRPQHPAEPEGRGAGGQHSGHPDGRWHRNAGLFQPPARRLRRTHVAFRGPAAGSAERPAHRQGRAHRALRGRPARRGQGASRCQLGGPGGGLRAGRPGGDRRSQGRWPRTGDRRGLLAETAGGRRARARGRGGRPPRGAPPTS